MPPPSPSIPRHRNPRGSLEHGVQLGILFRGGRRGRRGWRRCRLALLMQLELDSLSPLRFAGRSAGQEEGRGRQQEERGRQRGPENGYLFIVTFYLMIDGTRPA